MGRKRSRKQIYFPVANILAKRFHEVHGIQYLVEWAGCPIEEASWQPEKNLKCAELIRAFEAEHLERFEQRGMQIEFLERFIQENVARVSALADATVADIANAVLTDDEENDENENEVGEDEMPIESPNELGK